MPQTRSVSWFLLVTTITGMCLVASSRVMARVAWKPLVPGMTTSIRMRSGRSDFALLIASSPFSAVTTWYPCFDSVSMKNCRSVCESSTIKIFFMAMAISSGTNGRVCPYGFQKAILREGLGQIFIRAHHSATRPIKQAVLGRQHDHGCVGEVCVFLDQRAGLIPVQARHHDVHEDDVGLVVGDLGERVETVFGEDHLATGLNQEDLRAAANSVRIVDHHHFDPGKIRGFAHDLHPRKRPVFPVFRQFRRPSWAVARLHLVQLFTLYNQIQSKQSLVRRISEALSGSLAGTIVTGGMFPGVARAVPEFKARSSRSPPCARRIRDKSSSSGHPPNASRAGRLPRGDPPLRHRRNRISSTSRF